MALPSGTAESQFEFGLIEPGVPARLKIPPSLESGERHIFWSACVACNRLQLAFCAKPAVPEFTNGHVANIVAQDDADRLHRARRLERAAPAQLDLHGQSYITATRFMSAWYQGHPREHIAYGFFSHFPHRTPAR